MRLGVVLETVDIVRGDVEMVAGREQETPRRSCVKSGARLRRKCQGQLEGACLPAGDVKDLGCKRGEWGSIVRTRMKNANWKRTWVHAPTPSASLIALGGMSTWPSIHNHRRRALLSIVESVRPKKHVKNSLRRMLGIIVL